MFLEDDPEFMTVPIIRVTGPPPQQTLNEAAFSTPVHHQRGKGETVSQRWREGERKGKRERDRERILPESSRFQKAVPLITCVTLDDMRSQV